MEEIKRLVTDKDEVFVEIDQYKQHVFENQYYQESSFRNIFGGFFIIHHHILKSVVGKLKEGVTLVFPEKICLKVEKIQF